MRDKVKDTMERHAMLPPVCRVAVGVSGGADSVALLHVLGEMREELGLELSVLHFNHCLRGEESLRDQEFVGGLCKDWGIPLELGSAPVGELARKRGQSVEECAREERYAFFQDVAGRLDAAVATAHTLTDSLETSLLNLVRGTGLRGLAGIPPVRRDVGPHGVIRPLIGCTRTEVETYCRERGLSWVTDSTNLDEGYTRNRLRRRVFPLLREINPSLEAVAGETLALLREDEEYLSEQAELALARMEAMDNAGAVCGALPCAPLLELPPALRGRALIQWLGKQGLPYDRRRLELLGELARRGVGTVAITAGWFCRARSGRLEIVAPAVLQPPFSTELELAGEGPWYCCPYRGKNLSFVRMDCEQYEILEKDQGKPLKNAVDYDKIDWIISVRQRAPGDRLRPAGRGCGKTLKKLFNEAGLSPAARSRTVVLAAGERLLWVEGFGPDEEFRVRKGETRQVLYIRSSEGDV